MLDRRAALPRGGASRPLGELAMRGKQRALELYVLEASPGHDMPDGNGPRRGLTRRPRWGDAKGPEAA